MTKKDNEEINNNYWDNLASQNWAVVPYISFEQKPTAGSRVKLSTENHRSRDLGYLDYLSSAT